MCMFALKTSRTHPNSCQFAGVSSECMRNGSHRIHVGAVVPTVVRPPGTANAGRVTALPRPWWVNCDASKHRQAIIRRVRPMASICTALRQARCKLSSTGTSRLVGPRNMGCQSHIRSRTFAYDTWTAPMPIGPANQVACGTEELWRLCIATCCSGAVSMIL